MSMTSMQEMMQRRIAEAAREAKTSPEVRVAVTAIAGDNIHDWPGKTGVITPRRDGRRTVDTMPNPNEDYYGWTQETAQKLRQGRLSEVNMADLIEEIEDMGISQHHALESRLAVLLAHLLKWQYQSTGQGSRSSSWRGTINGQRLDIARLLKRNSSLRPRILELIHEIYPRSVQRAMEETNLPEETFPSTFEQTGWCWAQVLDMEFYPD